MDFELKGKKAIVSAGGSGIGRSIVDEFINKEFQFPPVILMRAY